MPEKKNWKNGIGITGGTGSGKSTVSAILRSRGFFVGDADAYARKAIEPGSDGLAEVRRVFGDNFFTGDLNDEKLDRKKLGNHIYKNPDERKKLESIIHPRIHNLLIEKTQGFSREQRWFYDAALLFEADTAKAFGEVWVVARDDALRIGSIVERDQISIETASRRLTAQMKQSEKLKLADRVLWNNGTIEELELKVSALLESSCIRPV